MRSLKFWIKVTRPMQGILGALATYIVAALSDGQDWFAPIKLAAACTFFLGILGASSFHFGAAHKMYARKDWDRIETQRPAMLISVGSSLLLLACIVAATTLPIFCLWICILNVFIVVCYARWLAKHWITKNIVIAFICTTPVFIGWLSGHQLHPALPYLATAVFFSYLTREIIKDYLDIKANDGIRVTLPLWLGQKHAHRALYVASVFAVCAACSLLTFRRYVAGAPVLVAIPYAAAALMFLGIAYLLIQRSSIKYLPTAITSTNSLLLIGTLLLKLR